MYVFAEGLKKAGKDLTTDKFIAALESIKDYRVSPIATPRTFTTKYHIGNLRLQALQVKNGHWEPIAWEGKRPSDVLSRYQ
jgi:branched-chain amino acid transport system substrate-binding protein